VVPVDVAVEVAVVVWLVVAVVVGVVKAQSLNVPSNVESSTSLNLLARATQSPPLST